MLGLPLPQDALLYATLFLGVLFVTEGVYQLAADAFFGPQATVNRRLQMLERAEADPRQVLARLRRDRQLRAPLERMLPFTDRLDTLVGQAGLSLSVGRLWLIVVGLGAAFFAAGSLLSPLPRPATAAASAVVATGIVLLVLLLRRSRRARAFEAQLPDALDLLVRSLRVGQPLNAALKVVAEEMPDPLGTEFGITVDEITYGQEVPDALARLSERIDLPDLRYFVVAVTIQYGAGGNLAEVLAALAKVIRERFQLFGKVRAITADGRLSAWFLSLFPIVMFFALQMIKADYYTQVADHPLFRPMVMIAIFMLGVNILAMRMMTNFKV